MQEKLLMKHLDSPLFERTRLVFEESSLERIITSKVLVAGLGGVGGFVVEALARGGVGHLVLVDHDVVSPSNLNRQLVALHSTLGRPKAEVMVERVRDINPMAHVEARCQFLAPNDMCDLLEEGFDVVVDAIDSLNCKVALLQSAWQRKVPVFSSMGAGRRIDPTKVKVADLMDTDTCGLARQVRQRLRKQGVGRGIHVVFSDEKPKPPGDYEAIVGARGRVVNGTASYMPGLFGLMLAGLVLQKLSEK